MKSGTSFFNLLLCLLPAFAGLLSFSLKAQNPIAGFPSPSTGCINENVVYRNTSSNATGYVWDFSFNDLNIPSVAALSTAVPGHNIPTGISLISDNGIWYGFLMNRDGNNIFRFNFGNDLENVPMITDLGNINGIFNGPQN